MPSAEAAATASPSHTATCTSSAPITAPESIAVIAASLRTDPSSPPRKGWESVARAVIVIVNTVVVRSGTAIRRTAALRTPIASASTAITA